MLCVPAILALPLYLLNVYPFILDKLSSQSKLIFDRSDSLADAEHSREFFSFGALCYLVGVFLAISYSIQGFPKSQGILDPALQCTAYFFCAITPFLLGAKKPQVKLAENIFCAIAFNVLIWSHASWIQWLVLNAIVWGAMSRRDILKRYGPIFYLNYLIIALEDSVFRTFIVWAFELTLRIQTDFSFVCAFYFVGLALLVLVRKPPHALLLYIHYWKTM